MHSNSSTGARAGRAGLGAASDGRVRLLAIDEQPAWVDPVLGQFFQQLRLAHGLTQPALALHIGTSVAVIDHLESGRLRALPPWAETERVVLAYGRLVAMDLGPAARRIRQLTLAADPNVEMAAGLAVARTAPPIATGQPSAPIAADGAPPSRPVGGTPLAPRIAWGGPWLRAHLGEIGARAWVTVAAGAVLVALASVPIAYPGLPGAIASAVAAGMPESLVRHMRAQHAGAGITERRDGEGLMWIEAADPKSRKADKLPSTPSR